MSDLISQHWFLSGLVMLGLLGLAGVALLSKYVRLMLNIIRDSPAPLLMRPFDYERIEGRYVTFRAFDGTSLRGMFLSFHSLPKHLRGRRRGRFSAATGAKKEHYLREDSRGVIIFCHEFSADMHSCTRYCLPLLQAGFDVFTFDFRSHGQSGLLPGYQPWLWCTDKEVSDCCGALAYVQAELEDRKRSLRIGMFGISRGACAALITASHRHSAGLVRAVLTDSAFSTDLTLESLMKKWAHIFAKVRFVYENHRPFFWHFLRWVVFKITGARFHCKFPSVRKALLRLKNMPVFFIHGTRDSYIRLDQAKRLFETARRPRYLWVVSGAKHNQSVTTDPERYAHRTVRFFETYLTGNDSGRSGSDVGVRADEAFFTAAENCDLPEPKDVVHEHTDESSTQS